MSIVSGIFALPKINKCAIFTKTHMEASSEVNILFKKKLPKGTGVYVSLDQSTTCTGVVIASEDFRIICQMDFMRKETDKYTYKLQLKDFIDWLVTDLKVKLLVIENPLNIRGNHATEVLQDLFKYIKNIKDDIDELKQVPFDTIFPQQWKECVVNKSKGKYRTGIKYEIASDICDIYPVLKNYLDVCPAKDYDSFDALGILLGYLKQHYNSEGKEIVYGTNTYGFNIRVFPLYLPSEEVDSIPLAMPYLKKDVVPKKFYYNNKFNFYKNLGIICSKVPVGYFIIEDLELKVNMLWETGVEPKEGYEFVCIVARQGTFTDKQTEKLKSLYGNYFYL